MKAALKAGLKSCVNMLVKAMGSTPMGRYLYGRILLIAMDQSISVLHGGVKLKFCTPNALNRYRANTFSTKEPETLEWLDAIPEGAILWDVGANVGLYACYAAKARHARVFAFEPSVFNLELLARNIYSNSITNLVTIVPLPLSETMAMSKLNMTSTDWGGAMSTFDQSYGHDGKPMNKVFEIPTIGLSMVDAVQLLKIQRPNYIKMDVDGIEHLILKGGMAVLREVSEILIEINDKFSAQSDDASKYLREAGLTLKEKRHADYFDNDPGAARHTFNQIWTR